MSREPTAVVKTHLPKTERDRLAELAARDGRSIAGQVAYLIRGYLQANEGSKGR